MEPKNVMLLGFVNKAAEYLDRHMDEKLSDSMSELKNIDLDSLKRELMKELEASPDDTAEELLKAGSDAFDKFMDLNKEESLSDEFDRMFDVDLDEEKPVGQTKDELTDFLVQHHLEEEFGLDKDAKEEVPTEETKEEENDYDLSPEESEMLELIAQNVNRKPEDKSDDTLSGANKDLDTIFSELVAAEDRKEEAEETAGEEKKEVKEKETETEAVPQEQKEVIIAPKLDSEEFGYIENPLVDSNAEVWEPEPDESDLVFPEQVGKDDIIRLIQDIQPNSDVYYNKIENFMDLQQKEDSRKKEKSKQENRYVSSLIDDLKAKMDKEDDVKKEAEEAYRQIFDSIHKTYPYLSNAFIRNVYDQKDEIAKDYPLNEKVVILHRTAFRNVENLRQYVEIALKHGYMINADEKKLIVDVFKVHVNSDGKIMASIYEVANQSALLSGEYEGYKVLLEEELYYKK